MRLALERYHAHSPWEAGAQLSWCRAQLPSAIAPAVFKALLKDIAAAGRIAIADGLARVPSHDPLAALTAADRRLALDIEGSLRDGGMSPQDVGDLVEGRQATALLRMLVELRRRLLLEGQLPGQRIAFHRSAVQCSGRKGAWPKTIPGLHNLPSRTFVKHGVPAGSLRYLCSRTLTGLDTRNARAICASCRQPLHRQSWLRQKWNMKYLHDPVIIFT